LELEGHGKGPLALGAWRSKNTRRTHILWSTNKQHSLSAIYLRDKLVLEAEGHGKGPLALGAWRSKNTRPTHILWSTNKQTLSPQSIYETSWFWNRRAKDPWRLALGGLRILARRIFCGVPCCFGGSVLRKWRIGATPTLRIHIIRLKTAKWGWLGPSKMAATPLLCLRAFDHFTPARPGRERLLVSDLHVRTDHERACESF
jgi:hypothetical protein